jgi:tripeptidyl-peptidase-1
LTNWTQELIKPRDSSTSTVLSWLKVAGVPSSDIDDRGDWINFSVVVAEAERLLGTKFYSFKQKNGKNSTQIIRTLQYSLPESIAPLVATIQPTTRFAQLRAQKTSLFEAEYMGKTTSDSSTAASTNKSSNPDATCSNEITPNCIRKLYNIGNYTANPRVGSLFGVCGYLEQYAKYVPLDIFLRTFARHAVGQNFTIQSINGGLVTQNDNEHDDIEANLDIQYAAALGYNQKIVYYSTGGRGKLVPDLDQPSPENNENEPYLEYLTYMLDLEDYELPQTITSSYGEDEQSIPKTYAKKICEMFGQLGLRGVSILVASGDTGPGSACQTNDGKNTTRLLPIFPASCPYVTSVGGTTGSEPEVAVGFSSGGFSDIFHRPSYQDNAVKHYLDYLGQEWKGLYNPHGRGFPDVAAQGRNFRIIDNATAGGYHEWLIGGTR